MISMNFWKDIANARQVRLAENFILNIILEYIVHKLLGVDHFQIGKTSERSKLRELDTTGFIILIVYPLIAIPKTQRF